MSGVTTIAVRVREWARTMPDRVALREKELGVWQSVTWRSYWDTVLTVGHALLALGVEPGDRVAIQAENRREWLYTDLATVAVRGTTVGLYPTNPPAEVSYLLSHSGAKVLIAEDQKQVDKAIAVIGSCPELECVVQVDPTGPGDQYPAQLTRSGAPPARLLAWTELLALGAAHRSEHPGAVEHRMAAAEDSDICTLIYTSGTTGPPKGAMLSVSNVEFALTVLMRGGAFISPAPDPRDELLSYLPLCHVAERIFTTWFNAGSGVQVYFAESMATVPANLREIQPSILMGVPRVWERLHASVGAGLRNASRAVRLNARVWLRVGRWIGDTLARTGGRHTLATRLVYGVGWVFFYRALRERLGMRRVRYAASGAAPIAPEVLRFFMGIGVAMHEVYGMTENSAVATANWRGRVKLGTVGEPHPDVEVRVDPATGEILTRHAGTFAGYFRDPEATAATLDAEGWLHTGDVGEWVDGTHLRITDRVKDIIITAGGKNVAPSGIELALKASPFVKEAILVGDRRPYLVALIGIEPAAVGDWAARRGITVTGYRDLSERPEVRALVQGVVDEVNVRLATVEQVRKFQLLPKELDHSDGELTATLKVKRATVVKLDAGLVDELYR